MNGPHARKPRTDQAGRVPALPTIRERVLAWMRIRGGFGLTDRELVDQLALPGDSVRPTRIKLTREGLIVDSGRHRDTRSGRAATVWVLADAVPAKREKPAAGPAVPELRLVELDPERPQREAPGQMLFEFARGIGDE